jgi:NAD/NADP transhydrogenase beta subunit
VIISLLNSCSGQPPRPAAFVLGNTVLIVSGAWRGAQASSIT